MNINSVDYFCDPYRGYDKYKAHYNFFLFCLVSCIIYKLCSLSYIFADKIHLQLVQAISHPVLSFRTSAAFVPVNNREHHNTSVVRPSLLFYWDLNKKQLLIIRICICLFGRRYITSKSDMQQTPSVFRYY